MKKILLILLLIVSGAYAVSFDCNKASTKIEKRICENNKLSNLDTKLAGQYELLTGIQNDKVKVDKLKSEQRKWLEDRNSKCTLSSYSLTDSCLAKKYISRIKELEVYDTSLLINTKDFYLNDKDSCLKVQQKISIHIDEKNVYSEYYYFDKKNRLLLLNTKDITSDFIKNANEEFKNVKAVKKTNEYNDGDNTLEKEEILYINNNIISFSTLSYGYYGGAHGNSRNYLELYDRHTGKLVEWKDIFQNNINFLVYVKNRIFNEIAEKEYVKTFNAQAELENFVETGYFTITAKGLLIKYPSYSIAPYSSGHPEILITDDELKKYMSEEKYKYYILNPNNLHFNNICETKSEKIEWTVNLVQCIQVAMTINETNSTMYWNAEEMRKKGYASNESYSKSQVVFGGKTYKSSKDFINSKKLSYYKLTTKDGLNKLYIAQSEDGTTILLKNKNFILETLCNTSD